MLDSFSQSVKPLGAFVSAYVVVMLIFVYGLRLPRWITGNEALVHEYYFQRWVTSFTMDFVFIALYVAFACVVWNVLGIWTPFGQGVVLIIVTALLTTGFCTYFLKSPLNSGQFFSRWFHGVRYRSVAYDVVLIGLIFVAYHLILHRLKRE